MRVSAVGAPTYDTWREPQKKTTGKRGKSLTLTVRTSESKEEDGDLDKPEPQQSGEIVLEAGETSGVSVDTFMQGAEDSIPVPQTDENLPGDESEVVGSVLLCIAVRLNGIDVTFLIDSCASEFFLSTTFAEKNKLKMTKTKEKLRIHLADGTVRVSNLIVE